MLELPVRREVDDLAHEHAGQRAALETAEPRALLARVGRHQPISSPVSSTNTSSRFAGRRSPVGSRAVRVRRRRGPRCSCPVRRVRSPAAPASASTSASRAGAPYTSTHLARPHARHELRRRPGGDRVAVRHDQHGVGQALRPPRCSASTSGSSCPRRAARRSAPRAPGAPADRARRSARRAARGAAGARAHGRSAGAGASRPRACRRACRGDRRASPSRAPARSRRAARRARRGRGARRRAGSARR